MYKGKIPFDSEDNLLSYIYGPIEKHGNIKDNFTFSAHLKFSHFTRGRSAAHAIFEDIHTHKQYPIFLTDLAEILLTQKINCGTILNTFEFTKRGQNYGIKLSINT